MAVSLLRRTAATIQVAVLALVDAAAQVGGLGLLGLMLLVSFDVIWRAVIGPYEGTLEIAQTTLVIVVFLSFAAVHVQDRELKISSLITRMPAPIQRVGGAFGSLATMSFFGLMIVSGWSRLVKAWEFQDYEPGFLHIPSFIPLAGLVFGAAVALVAAALTLVKQFIPSVEAENRTALGLLRPPDDGVNS